MELSEEQLQDLVAKRLLTNAEVSVKHSTKRAVKENQSQTESSKLVTATPATAIAEPDFIKVEKNLASLGFFTPSSKKIKGARGKTISFTRWIDGKRIEAKVTIAPAALYGLPITADQDKYLALQKIINDLRQEIGEIKNPIGFTSAELLRLLGKRVRTGKNYDDIVEWLKRMTLTGIISEGVVYFAGKKTWATDTFHVFERSISFGQELPDGTTADKNYIWLSSWQLENINSNYLLPIDFDTYKQLKNHISKALAPLLQIWLYAARDDGYFEKRYDELCQILNVRQYYQISRIKEQFAFSLDELKKHSYLSDWQIEKTSDGKAYKIIFYHGEKFHRDRRKRLEQKEQKGPKRKPRLVASSIEPALEQGSELQSPPKPPEQLLTDEQKQLFKLLNMEFGVTATTAYELITKKPQETKEQLGAWSYRNIKPNNPGGWIIEAIESNYALPPAYLEQRRKQEEQEKSQARRAAIDACTICNESGWRIVKRTHPDTGQEEEAFRNCTHNPEIENKFISVL